VYFSSQASLTNVLCQIGFRPAIEFARFTVGSAIAYDARMNEANASHCHLNGLSVCSFESRKGQRCSRYSRVKSGSSRSPRQYEIPPDRKRNAFEPTN
jgi:hypothetical protein